MNHLSYTAFRLTENKFLWKNLLISKPSIKSFNMNEAFNLDVLHRTSS